MRIKDGIVALDFKVLIVDDEQGIIDSLMVVLKRNGYKVAGETDPLKAIERLKVEKFDLLVLDFLMYPIHGDKVVEEIRKFDQELYILLLTGHKDLAPPIETIRELDIQGYCEKGDRFDQLLLLIESGIKSITQMRTIRKFKDGLNKILLAVPKIYQLQPIDGIMEGILEQLLPLIDSQNAFILADDVTNIYNKGNEKSIFKGLGKYKVEVGSFIEMLGPELMEQVGRARTKKEIIKVDQGLILPLLNDFRETIGVIFVQTENINEGQKILEIYCNQAASSLNNAFLHSLVNVKNEELNRTYEELRKRYMDTIEALRLAVDAKDIYTRGHSDRVAYYSNAIGVSMELTEKELENIKIGGVFHDIGKIGTADDILLKSVRLSKEEFDEIKKHPIKGAHILSAVSMFHEIVPMVRCHHERVDGKGYPDGLKGDEIPLLARIISVADSFDAMMSDRHYRTRLSLEDARKQLLEGSGTQFDAEVIQHFNVLLENVNGKKNEVGAYEI